MLSFPTFNPEPADAPITSSSFDFSEKVLPKPRSFAGIRYFLKLASYYIQLRARSHTQERPLGLCRLIIVPQHDSTPSALK